MREKRPVLHVSRDFKRYFLRFDRVEMYIIPYDIQLFVKVLTTFRPRIRLVRKTTPTGYRVLKYRTAALLEEIAKDENLTQEQKTCYGTAAVAFLAAVHQASRLPDYIPPF